MMLHDLATAGDVEGLRAALARGAAVDERREGWTPLMLAAGSASAGVEAVGVLVAHGADVDAVRKVRKHGEERPLQLAIRAGDLAKVDLLIAAGAPVTYRSAAGYDALLDAVYAAGWLDEEGPGLALVTALVDRGAPLDGRSSYGETGLNVASRTGRWDLVRLLLDRGASAEPLGWGPLGRAVTLGSLADVEEALRAGDDRARRDAWGRTPWMLSLEVGDRAKAERLFAAGVDRDDLGDCGSSAVALAAGGGDPALIAWLLDEGFAIETRDTFSMTPLMHAVREGHLEAARLLLSRGADVHAQDGDAQDGDLGSPVVSYATSRPMLTLLLDAGGDLADASEEMRRVLRERDDAHLPTITAADFRAGAGRRFGRANPERMDVPFWSFMIVWGKSAFAARDRFAPDGRWSEPVFCYSRYGQSVTFLPDGRIVEIGGEHEDSYDSDFCIYNDVVVHQGGGRFTVLGYPKEVFAPTDFHTATYHRGAIYVVGSLGYAGERAYSTTPVYRLDCATFAMERVATSGPAPGWIYKHRARLEGEQIVVTGGEVATSERGAEVEAKNERVFALDLGKRRWTERA